MKVVHLDYEFRSGVDITEVGSHRTSIDPRFELFMASVSTDDSDRVLLWVNPLFPAYDCPSENEEVEALLASADEIYAHNAPNEQANTWGALSQGKACPFKTEPDLSVWRCTAAMARKAGLPYSLDKLGAALRLDTQKDKEGKALINFFSKPDEETDRFNETRDHPEKWRRFCSYCIQDNRAEKAAHQKLKAFELTGAALATFQFDLRMNQRGIPINLVAARNAQKIIDHEQAGVTAEFRKLTGLNPTQGKKFKVWLLEHGCEMENLQATTVETSLGKYDSFGGGSMSQSLPATTLRLFQKVSYAAVKKIQTMLDCVCPDGRVRGAHMYYGAGTGRWSSRILQIQNFRKPDPEFRPMLDQIYAAIGNGITAQGLDLIFGSPLECIANCIRNFIHLPGTEMLDGDFAAVEARIICWLAGQDDVLQMWREGQDIYRWMAGHIYGIDPATVDSDKRGVGKRVVLGCFAYDTPVLTKVGLKPLGEITCRDWLWDGLDWVQSDGVVYQGCQQTINLLGLEITSDHSILCGASWVEASHLARDGSMRCQALETALVSLPSQVIEWAIEEGFLGSRFNAPVGNRSTASLSATLSKERRLDAPSAPEKLVSIRVNITGDMRTSFLTEPCESDYSIGCVAACLGAIAGLTPSGSTTGEEASMSSLLGGKTDGSFCDTSSPSPTTRRRNATLTASTTSKATSQGTSASPPNERTFIIDALLSRSKIASISSKPRLEDSLPLPVYDLANCGPRNRFTIWTEAGPMIAHNCGFQMGWRKFQSTCKVQYQLDLSTALCKKGIKMFRKLCGKIRDYWWYLNNSATEAIKFKTESGPFSVRTIAGIPYLLFRLRSGRSLAYPYPEVNLVKWQPEVDEDNLDEFGEVVIPEVKWRDEITYWGEIKPNIWGRVKIYGGKFAENETQATAADFMAHGAITAEGRGMPPFMLVHDQGLALRAEGKTAEDYAAALGDLPTWAKGFPMKVEAKITPYYRK